jgi:glutathione S-transferase
MGLKLHYHPLSTFSRRVLIAFAEKQVPHELVVAISKTASADGKRSQCPGKLLVA